MNPKNHSPLSEYPILKRSPSPNRVDAKVDITAHTNKCKAIPRLKSPVKGESTPEYCLYFHARDNNGKLNMSYTQSIDRARFGEILILWILDNHSRLNYHPIDMAKAILNGVKGSWYQITENLKK